MKTIIVVFAFCLVGALALTEEQKTKLTEYKNSCITETSVDTQVVDNAKNGNYAKDDEKLGCFTACMLKKIGIMNPDGSVNFDVARKKAPSDINKDQVEDVISKCKDSTGSNECQTASKLAQCFLEKKSFNLLH
ncbi:general odorant-binding protein 56d-like [Xylocopa sonorina]|uniref:general odorant-binding protein 56d-like n=1 Tax=Xylocopa sonorina TaxID=1818115 RepID=UPI00403A8A80